MIVALLAACGWFLMLPPSHGQTILRNAPVSQWLHVSSYDTATACEVERVEFGKIPGSDPNPNLNLQALRFTLCIPADRVPVK